MKRYRHTCKHCGTLFVSSSSNTKYCSQICRTKANEARMRAERQEKYERRHKESKELDRVAAEANAAGLSYGKYVAMMDKGER